MFCNFNFKIECKLNMYCPLNDINNEAVINSQIIDKREQKYRKSKILCCKRVED